MAGSLKTKPRIQILNLIPAPGRDPTTRLQVLSQVDSALLGADRRCVYPLLLLDYTILRMTTKKGTRSVGPLEEQISDDDLESLASPAKKQAVNKSSPLTLEMLQGLFEKHSREIRDSQKLELNRAMAQTNQLVQTIEGKLDKQGEVVNQLQGKQEDFEKRLSRLETSGSTTAASLGVDEGVRSSVVFGGSVLATKKAMMLAELEEALKDLNIRGCLENDPYCPGVRKGICVAPLQVRDAETPADTRERMLKVVKTVSDHSISTKHMEDSKTLWCAVSRPKAERDRARHAGKLRRLLHSIDGSLVNQANTEYPTGSLWVADYLLGSAIKPKPTDAQNLAEGKLAGSWVSITRVAKLCTCSEAHAHKMWQDAISDGN